MIGAIKRDTWSLDYSSHGLCMSVRHEGLERFHVDVEQQKSPSKTASLSKRVRNPMNPINPINLHTLKTLNPKP